MSSTVVLLVSCACAAVLLAAVGASSPADLKSVSVVPSSPGPATSRQVVDGVLSMLGVTVPEASGEDDADAVESDSGDTKLAKSPGERGIHKKKLWLFHLWNVYSWWAWAFAIVVIKFKIALLVIWGHLTYFVVALIRMLLREVPSWIQLKTVPAPYGPPPAPVYGPAPTSYGPQYGQQYGQQQYASAGSYSPYKRRAGNTQATAGTDTTSAGTGDLAYAAHARRK